MADRKKYKKVLTYVGLCDKVIFVVARIRAETEDNSHTAFFITLKNISKKVKKVVDKQK